MQHIVLTCGDPNGIGLEVGIKALTRYAELVRQSNAAPVRFSLIVHPETFWQYVGQIPALKSLVQRTESGFQLGEILCGIIHCTKQVDVEFGKETRDAGELSWEALRISAELLRKGAEASADAVVTLPVSKRALHLAAFPFPGQTEFYAQEFGTDKQMMILATEAAELDPKHAPVRVGLATVHLPLREVVSRLSEERILERIIALNSALQRDFAIAQPRIAVLGVNPHAGEQGDIGLEEIHIIEPALKAAQNLGIHAEGAFPADGFFAHGAFRSFDGILAMYHDQGLIPLKLLAGNGGVNFSAGLPIIRTSPDHGTAFALAGKGIANEASTFDAIQMALSICNNRTKFITQ